MAHVPRVVSVTEMSASEAKWVTLNKIRYIDAKGTERQWESGSRKTRKSSGIDAVCILALIQSKTKAFPLSTVIIEQYRPPMDQIVIELPAGLIDESETAEEAAFRELTEETGYIAQSVIDSTPVVASDPGLANTNMKLVTLAVILEDAMETPAQNLEPGEFIVKRVVEIAKLKDELTAYDAKGCIVDARLSHFAEGLALAARIQAGELS